MQIQCKTFALNIMNACLSNKQAKRSVSMFFFATSIPSTYSLNLNKTSTLVTSYLVPAVQCSRCQV